MSQTKATKPLQPSQAPYQIGYVPRPIQSRPLRPLSFLAVREKVEYVFQHLSPDETKKLITKHFGKKVTLITKHTHVSQLCRRSKYFKKLDIKEKPQSNRATDSPAMLLINKDTFSSHRDQVIMVEDISVERKHHLKLVPAKLKWISIQEGSSSTMSLARSLIEAQGLRLSFSMDQLKNSFRSILRLRSVRQIELNISKSVLRKNIYFTKNQLGVYLIKALCKKSLRVINLDLSCQPLSPVLLEKLVTLLNNAEVTKWYIKTEIFADDDFLMGRNYSQIFANLDYLGLETPEGPPRNPTDPLYSFSQPPKYHYLPECDCNPIRIQEILAQSKRALSLKFNQKMSELNLRPILESCDRLESLNINVKGIPVSWEGKIKEINSIKNLLSWTENIQNVILTSHDESRNTLNHKSWSEIEDDPDLAWKSVLVFRKLLNIIKEGNWRLKYARISSCCINSGCYGAVHCMINHASDLKAMASLEHVDLSFSLFYPHPGNLLNTLPNLKKLDIRCESDYDWDGKIPFEDMEDLTELRVFVGDKESSLGLDDSDYYDSGDGEMFIQSLDKLKNLEVFELHCADPGMSLNAFLGFLNGFCQLKNLRKIILNTRIVEDPDSNQMSEEISDDDIHEKVETIIKRNPQLQHFYVREVQLGVIETIKYKK